MGAVMEPVTTAILGALVAGATAAASETASQAVKDAYAGLKRVLQDGYKMASMALLDKKPSEPSFQKAVEAELEGQPKAANDPAVLEHVKAVQEALKKEPPERLTAWGVDVGRLKAAGDIIAERISGTGGGFRADEVESGGSVRFSDITGGTSGKP
jgi:hypothetical protein